MSIYNGFTESLGSERLIPATKKLTYEMLKTLSNLIRDNTQPNSQNLKLLNTIKDFPENSHIENYILFDSIILDKDIDDIIDNHLKRKLIETSDTTNKEKEKIESLFLNIDKRRFLSLLVLISRNSKDGFILSNDMKSLYDKLHIYFKKYSNIDKTSISENIKNGFINFIIKTSSPITTDLINSILSGKELYKIYKIGYSRKNKTHPFSVLIQPKQTHSLDLLSSELIKKRTNNWLSKPKDINSTPIAYIFDDYSKDEKIILIKTNKFCKEISQLTDDIKEFHSSSFEISKSIFSNNELDTFTKTVKDTYDSIQKKESDRTNKTHNNRERSKSHKRTHRNNYTDRASNPTVKQSSNPTVKQPNSQSSNPTVKQAIQQSSKQSNSQAIQPSIKPSKQNKEKND